MFFEFIPELLKLQSEFFTFTLLGGILFFAITIYNVWHAILQLWKSYKQAKDLDKIAGTEAKHWFYGHLPKYGFDHNGIKNTVERSSSFPGIFNKWLGPLYSAVQVYHPDTALPLLKSGAPKGCFVYEFMRPWVGDGLLTSRGEKWHRHRRMLTPAFHFSVLQPYMKISNECVRTFLDNMRREIGKPFELVEPVSLLALDILMQCAMSAKTNCQNARGAHPYITAINTLSRHVFIRLENPLYLFDFFWNLSTPGRIFSKACDDVHAYAEKVITERRKVLDDLNAKNEEVKESEFENGMPQFKKRGKKILDFLDILLQTKDDDGKGLTSREIRDHVDSFLFGGHDTTASAISWTLYNFAKYPEYQERCREEVNDVLKEEKDVKWEDLPKFNHLTMFIKESMRMNSPVPSIGRQLNEPLKIRSTFLPSKEAVIPDGSNIGLDIFALHKNPHVWENPNVFNPERFSRENSAKRSPHAFLPFSAGSRNCIRQNFAMNEIKVVLSQILRKYQVYLDEETPEPIMQTSLILRSTNGIFIKFRPISTTE
ncbi:cytochrome P450 4F6-like [Clavelina lepadiformis]|uniref:cytochrome P450 4F6-like n=1 Tax=Clavelina lepadiformis TaxID=159417 RepID=UPI0040439045